MDARPEMAKIPSVARTQMIRSTPAICLKGEGSTPIAQQITAKIRMFQRVIDCPLITKSCTSGIVGSPSILKYPKNQSAISTTNNIPNIDKAYSKTEELGSKE